MRQKTSINQVNKPDTKDDYTLVIESYKRCCLQDDFIDSFYYNFFQSSPLIPPLFAHTDMNKQKRALKSGLPLVLVFAKENNENAKSYLKKIAKIHDRNHLNIVPSLYSLWADTLIKTISQCDPDCTPELEEKWRSLIQKGIDYMIANY